MHEPHQPPIKPPAPRTLHYASPPSAADKHSRPKPFPSMRGALTLAVPGLICWFQFLDVFVLDEFVAIHAFRDIHLDPGIWLLACCFAVFSIIFYWSRPKPWYVWLTLILNIAGLIASIAIVALIIIILRA